MDETNAVGDMGTDGGWLFAICHSHILARLFICAPYLAFILGEALASKKTCTTKQAQSIRTPYDSALSHLFHSTPKKL